MIGLSVSDEMQATFQRLGLPLEELSMWWGALPALQRADDEFGLFSAERRQALDDMARKTPSDLVARDKAFYSGLLIEAAVSIGAEVCA